MGPKQCTQPCLCLGELPAGCHFLEQKRVLQQPWKCPSACVFPVPASLPSPMLTGNQTRPKQGSSQKAHQTRGFVPQPWAPQPALQSHHDLCNWCPASCYHRSQQGLASGPLPPTAMSGSAWRPHQNQGCSGGSVFWVPLCPWPAARGQRPGPLEQASLLLPAMVVGKQALLARGMGSLLLCVTHLHLTGKGETGRGKDHFKVKQERLRKHKSQ